MTSKRSYAAVVSSDSGSDVELIGEASSSVSWMSKYQQEDEVSAFSKAIELSVNRTSHSGTGVEGVSKVELEMSDNEFKPWDETSNKVTTLLSITVYSSRYELMLCGFRQVVT
jgi:hypothetical protein